MNRRNLNRLFTVALVGASAFAAGDAGATGQSPVLIPPRITDATVALIDPESGASSGSGGATDTKIAVGDVISFRFSLYPVPDKILRGMGGWLTEYVPANTEVVGVRFIDAAGNTVEPELPGRAASGSVAHSYADTGVFYSNDARFARIPTPATANFITLANGSQMTAPAPASGGIVGPLIGNTSGNYFTHNAWDFFQEGKFGNSTTASTGFGSPVASTTSFDQYEGNSGTTVGPWTRIMYPGSYGWPAGVARPAPAASDIREGQLLPTAVSGTDIVDVTPLSPATARAVRWAGGELRTGVVTQAEVFLRIKGVPLEPTSAGTAKDVNCAEAFGGETSKRETGGGGGTIMWPFHVPSPGCVFLNLLFTIDVNKTLSLPGDTLTYTINGRNLSTNATGQQNVVVTMKYDSAATPTAGTCSAGASAPVACPGLAGYNCISWNLGTLAPSATYTRKCDFTVSGANGKDNLTTFATYTSTQLPGGYTTQVQNMVTGIFVQQATLSMAATSVAPNGTTTITGNLINAGTNNGDVNSLDIYLPANWTLSPASVTLTPGGTTSCTLVTAGSGHYTCGISINGLSGSRPFSFVIKPPAGTATGLYTIDLSTIVKQTSYGGASETYFPKRVTVPVTKVRAAAPVLQCNFASPVPISNSSTTIKGTSTEADGTVINVYFNGIFRGTTTVAGGNWSFTGFVGSFGSLYAGLEVTATAAARDGSQTKLESPKSGACFVSPVPGCADGVDNDGDGKCDFFGCVVGGMNLPPDPGCVSPTDNDEADTQCTDGIDNNTNSLIDYPADPACFAPWDTTEGNPACSDGIDNDGDGKIDLADPDCVNAADPTEGTAPACADGIDNDGDGKIDFGTSASNDPGCHSSNDNNEADTAVAESKPRIMLIVDTSGSMNWNACSDVSFTGGDGSSECPGGDVACGDVASCNPQPAGCGNSTADDSRIYKVKAGVRDVVSGFGEVTYGLMRYHQVPAEFTCPTRNATFPSGGWQGSSANPGMLGPPVQAGACGTFEKGDVLVSFASDNAYDLLQWVDGSSNYTGAGDIPAGLDIELRGSGTTPIAGTLDTALSYLSGVKASDSIAACRPYDIILLTDGAESCGGDPASKAAALLAAGFKVYVIGFAVSDAASQASINAIASSGGTNSAIFVSDSSSLSAALANIVQGAVKVEVCNGVDDNCNGLIDEGTGAYKECTAANQAIVCGSGICDQGRCTCTTDAQCGSGFACGAAPVGSPNATRYCLPSCSVGTLACQRTGVVKACGTQCCVNDGQGACTVLTAATTTESCNGIDDNCDGVVDNCGDNIPGSCCSCPACAAAKGATPSNPLPETCDGCDEDCDGIADNHLTDVGLGCGVDVGTCSQGITACCQESGASPNPCTVDAVTESGSHVNTDALKCVGGKIATTEVCNGVDDDCNGQTDEVTQACFPFPAPAMAGTGTCVAGTATCNAVALPAGDPGCPAGWPAGKACPGNSSFSNTCNGALGPGVESCNGVDDDCDGQIDEGITGGQFGTACCPAGQNCTNTAGGTRCQTGTIQCQNGQAVCVGAVFRTPEVCDSIDNDCDGEVDTDTPGINSPCTGSGIFTAGECRAVFQCPGGIANPNGPRGLTCVQTVPPSPIELCNNKDDNCNGQIDENLQDPLLNQRCDDTLTPAEMTNFPNSSIDTLPCMPGHTVCENGAVVCTGRVGPKPNQCDGISVDCTGNTNTNGNCPNGLQCVNGTCAQPCSMGEFPCPGGFACTDGFCIPDGCQTLNCPAGNLCQIDQNGMPVCIDPCTNVNCPSGFRCQLGVCVDDTCLTFGCPEGQLCAGNPPTCTADPCFNVVCPTGQYCNGQGDCVVNCPETCMKGDVCISGMCVPDPCKGVQCKAGEVCSIQQGVGVCIENQCLGGCRENQTCCGGMCVDDQCRGLLCPEGSECKLDATCVAVCQGNGAQREKIVGAGGGGFACSYVGGEQSNSTTPISTGAMMLLLAGLGFIRRRRVAARTK